jgi:hypothetical protein
MAAVRSVYLETFGSDVGEVRVGGSQLTSWRADRALQWRRHGLPCRGITATDQCACDQTRNHKQMFLIVGHLATPLSDAAFPSAALRSS